MPAKKAAKKTTSSKLKVKVKDLKAKKDTKAGAGSLCRPGTACSPISVCSS